MATLTVGQTGQRYQTIDAAVDASQAGDTIEVQAGTYTNDWLSISHDLTLTAIGGWVRMVTADGAQPPDGKAMITESGTVTISGFDISGVTVPDNNGAAIRYEGGNLTLDNVYIHDNQDGLLGAPDANGSITIDHSEFAFNGVGGDGHTHGIYIGQISTFSLINSYVHDTNEGHEVKSRAASNIIQNNRIFDNNSTASYSIDLPDAGNATISGNVIEQGPNTHNPAIIAYGEESGSNAGRAVLIDGNVLVNDRSSASTGIWNATASPIISSNNQIWGNAPNTGPVTENGNTILPSRPTLDLSTIGFIGSATPPPAPPIPSPPPPTPLPEPPAIPPAELPPPDPVPILSPLDLYHAEVLADFSVWSTTHAKLATQPRVLAVLNTELHSTTVLGVIRGDKWSV